MDKTDRSIDCSNHEQCRVRFGRPAKNRTFIGKTNIMRKTEKILAALSFLGVFMIHLDIPGAAILSIVVVMVLSIFYMAAGYFLFGRTRVVARTNGVNVRESRPGPILMGILFGFCLAHAITGILFTLMEWPGDVTMLVSGLAAVFSMSLIYALFFNADRDLIRNVIVRAAGVGATAAVVLLIQQI